jgi:protein pelota
MRIAKKLPVVTATPESLDDLWHLEKVIERGDLVTGHSERRFKTEAGESERKHVKVKLRVEGVEFHKPSAALRITGVVVEAAPAEYVAVGTHHTLEVAPGTVFWIEKTAWKNWQLDRLDEAVRASKTPKLVIVALDDEEAEVVFLRDFGTEHKASISSGKSGKRYESKYDPGKYFAEVADTLAGIQCDRVLVAGPGFAKDGLVKLVREKNPELARKILVESVGSGGKPGVQEVLKRGLVEKVVEKSRAAEDARLVEELLAAVAGGLAAYGVAEVLEALDYGAAETLLVTDELFTKKRDEMEKLFAKAEAVRCRTRIVSVEGEAGQQLKSLGGIAAKLRFKIK